MEDIGIAVGQKWVTRSGHVVTVVVDEKDNQPFCTDARTWHFKDGRMWKGCQCGGDLIRLLDEDPEIKDVSDAAAILAAISARAAA